MALLDPLYDAAADAAMHPALWKAFLQKTSEVLRADKAALILHDPEKEWISIRVDLGVSAELRRDAEELNDISPWSVEIRKYEKQGWYCGSPEDVLPIEEFRKSKYYNELFRKHNFEWVATSTVFGPRNASPSLVVSRSKTALPFSVEEKEVLKELVPHLGRAFRLHSTFSAFREKYAAGQHALDLIGAACITLDCTGRVLSMNKRAESLVADGERVRVDNHRLLAALSVEQSRLDECVLSACACGSGQTADPGSGALVVHSAQGTPLYVSALPYRSSWPMLDGAPAALVFVTSPEESVCGEHRLWQSMFGLSPAECRVAEMMKKGLDVTEISDAIRIKVDTVRYYQKCVYRKTGVRGQSQLLRLLTRLPSST